MSKMPVMNSIFSTLIDEGFMSEDVDKQMPVIVGVLASTRLLLSALKDDYTSLEELNQELLAIADAMEEVEKKKASNRLDPSSN